MFRVLKKEKTPNIIWDSAANRPLCKFVKGIFETDDQSVAGKLRELGYQVEEIKPEETQMEEAKAEKKGSKG